MSELIKSNLKDISATLNLIQSKRKDFLATNEITEKNYILQEIKENLQKIKEYVK
ncbi:MAG: hypothetical protein MJ252_05095 [archaeon]|nr:hypothetical protein [archaeon]